MNKSTARLGYYSALIAFIAAVTYGVVQILQVMGVLVFPLDEILIFGSSLCISVPFILTMLALHYVTPNEKKLWSHAALIFTVMYAVYAILNYVVQLGTVIPMKLQGPLGELQLLAQDPHSLCWDLDALGYIFMGIAMFFAVPLFAKQGFEKWVRHFFLANALMTPVISVVYFYPNFSVTLMMILGTPWLITAPGAMIFLALYFKKMAQENKII